MLSTDTWLKIFAGMMINAVLFGIGIVTTLSVPALATHATIFIPAVVVLSFALSPFIAAAIAPRMRLRRWGKEKWQRGDVLSGGGMRVGMAAKWTLMRAIQKMPADVYRRVSLSGRSDQGFFFGIRFGSDTALEVPAHAS